jgi:hypothetical protein
MFINPWAITIGIVAAALPVAVHFLTRPRPVSLPLSTLRFVTEAVQHRRTRHRLRDAIVLALRTLAVALIAGAVARPFVGGLWLSAADEQADLVRVVILDVSQSLGAVSHGVEAFERARPLAAKKLEYRRGMKCDLILAGARPTSVFTRASTNFPVLRDELARARVRPERLAVQEALNLASQIIAREEGNAKLHTEVAIVSDFQRSNWGSADFSVLPAGTHIELESAAPDETPPNLAILRVAAQGRAEMGRDLRLEVEVGNFSNSPQTITVDLLLGDENRQFAGLCGPYSKTVLTGEIALRQAGWQTGEARLIAGGDALAPDNTRPFVVDVRQSARISLVTRESATKRPSASYFLERALAPFYAEATGDPDAPSGAGIPRLDPARIDRDALAAADLLVVVQPGRLSEDAVNQLASAIRRGRGILYVASDSADAANLQLLAARTSSLLKLPVEFLPPSARQSRRNRLLAKVTGQQSPFQIFGDDLTALTETLRFSGGLDTRATPGGLAEDLLAQFDDGSAFLVSATMDAGGLMVLNADLAASNLPLSPLYVPLLGEIVQKLLGQGRRAAEIACGEPFALSLPPDAATAAELNVTRPDGAAVPGADLADDGAGILWKGEAADTGVYRVQHKSALVFAAAAAIPDVESDLRSLPAEVFQERLAGGRDVRFRSLASHGADERDSLWSWLAVACVACLAGEVLALKSFKT